MHILTPMIGIEVSRKCNLDCTHCMRGESENLSIDREVLNKFFDEVKSANKLVISGGEPFMCYDEIKDLVEIIELKNVLISKVIIVTNGTIYDEKIYKLLKEHFSNISINISLDDYHLESIMRKYSSVNLSDNPRLHPINVNEIIENIKLHMSSHYFGRIYGVKKYLIDIGRASYLDKPKKDFEPLGYFYTEVEENVMIAGPQIYLDSQGYITDGNSSYVSRNEISIGNLRESTIYDMLINNAIKIDPSTTDEFIEFLRNREYDYQKFKGKSYVYKNNKIVELANNKNG